MALKGETDAFIKFRSCGIDEIKQKVMAEPEAFKESSVFIASKAQIEMAKLRERMLRNMARQQTFELQQEKGMQQTNKILKAILKQEETHMRDPFRIKKAV